MFQLSRLRYILLFPLVPLALFSCSTFDPPTVVPAYGHIDSIHFTVTVDSQGTASNQIPYAWVYLDDNPVGAFQMPCTFPIVASNGTHNIKIYPGIIPANGNSPAAIDPFYQFYSVSVNLQQGSTTKFQPVSTYFNWVDFPLLETFDNELPNTPPVHIIRSTGTQRSDTGMVITKNRAIVFDGNGGSGMAIVNSKRPVYCGETDPLLDLPANGSTPVYMEMNYRATALFSVGLYEGDTNYVSPLVIFPTATWNKMYVVFQSTLSVYSLEPDRIYFYIALDSTDGHTQDTLLLDNIKILD